MAEATRKCTICGIYRPLSEHYADRKKSRACRPCNRTRMLARVAEQTAYIQAIKLAAGCMDCGVRYSYPEIYEFDHRPGEVKVGDISKLRLGPMAQLIAEIAKCDVVCANCHRIRTVSRRDAARGYGMNRAPRPAARLPVDQMTLDWSA